MRLREIEKGNAKSKAYAKEIERFQQQIEDEETDGDIPSDVYSEVERLEREGDTENARQVLDIHLKRAQARLAKWDENEQQQTVFPKHHRASRKSQKRVNQLASDYTKR